MTNSAKHARFVNKIREMFMQEPSAKSFDELMLKFENYFASENAASSRDKRSCLITWSDPTENQILWKSLKTEVML